MIPRKIFACVAFSLVSSFALAVPVELIIEFDNFPNETAFGMWDAVGAPTGAEYAAAPGLVFDGIAYDVGASSPIGFGDGFVLPGDFTGEPPNVPFNFVWDLGVGGYRFTILDTFGDGICCGFGAGSYSLSVDGVEVGAGGEFLAFEVTDFDVTPGSGIPVPGMLALLSIGFFGLGLARRRA